MAQLRSGARVAESFAGRGLRRWIPMAAVIAAVGIGFTVLFVSQNTAHNQAIAGATADAKPWELVGPACPEGFSGPWANPQYAPNKPLVFNGVRFSRRAGHVDCSAVAAGKGDKEDYVPLCQFSGPIVLEVTTAKGTFHFQPGVGKPASVSVVDGTPRCVMAISVQF